MKTFTAFIMCISYSMDSKHIKLPTLEGHASLAQKLELAKAQINYLEHIIKDELQQERKKLTLIVIEYKIKLAKIAKMEHEYRARINAEYEMRKDVEKRACQLEVQIRLLKDLRAKEKLNLRWEGKEMARIADLQRQLHFLIEEQKKAENESHKLRESLKIAQARALKAEAELLVFKQQEAQAMGL